jgi:delta-aminolevulinic acid dehydratase/porphobilinogen synthase
MFPITRPRRLRQNSQLRRMVRETVLTADDLIYPLFAVPGESIAQEVKSMPGVYQLFCLAFQTTKMPMRRGPGTTAESFKKQPQQSKKPYQI